MVEVKNCYWRNLKLLKDAEVQYLQPHKSKSLSIAKEQNLDGDGLINLASSMAVST